MTELDPTQLPELSARQEDILALIVRSYNEHPEPVSSKYLVDTYDLSISSATVRNEMARLEDMGYIVAPHTSAGRIPTALGYRYVVRKLIDENTLSSADRHYINTKFNELPAVLDQWMRQAATVLARTAQTASLVTPPVAETDRFKHMELISIQGRLALMVLVLQGGSVHQRMLNLADPVSQASLSESAGHVNALLAGLNATQIRMKSRQFNVLEREVAEIAADMIDRMTSTQARIIYRDGLSEIINAFPDSEGAQQAVRVFEERAFIDMILSEILQPILADEVQVIIAGDGREEMSQLSMVMSHYGMPGQLRGALGILGPMNINYGRAIGTVKHISRLMTDMLKELYDEPRLSDDNGDLGDVNTSET